MPTEGSQAPRQNPNLTFEQLYAQAHESAPLMKAAGEHLLIDVRKKFPGKFDTAYLEMAPTKDLAGALSKVHGDYAGDHSLIVDLTRGRIVVQTAEQARILRDYIHDQSAALNIKRIKDRFATPNASGFRDMLTTVELGNGHMAELRIEQNDMIKAAKDSHPPYKRLQQLTRAAVATGLVPNTQELDERQRLLDEVRDHHQRAAERAGLDPLLNDRGRERLRDFARERILPAVQTARAGVGKNAINGPQTPQQPGQTAPPPPQTMPPPTSLPPTTSEHPNSPPETHAPEIHEPEVHGKGGIVAVVGVGILVGGAELIKGATSANAAVAGGKTILDGAIPGISDGFKNITQKQSWLDRTLNIADTATGGLATVAAATTAATSPLALTGYGAAVPIGAAMVTGAASLSNVAVALVSDGLTYAGLTHRGGLIHGVSDLTSAYVHGIKSYVGSGAHPHTGGLEPQGLAASAPANMPLTRGRGRGAMRSILSKEAEVSSGAKVQSLADAKVGLARPAQKGLKQTP